MGVCDTSWDYGLRQCRRSLRMSLRLRRALAEHATNGIRGGRHSALPCRA